MSARQLISRRLAARHPGARGPGGALGLAGRPEGLYRHGQLGPARVRREQAVGTENERRRDDESVGKAESTRVTRSQLGGRARNCPGDRLNPRWQGIDERVNDRHGLRAAPVRRDQALGIGG